jgi:tetratricopeptide (TPR) repeat protein
MPLSYLKKGCVMLIKWLDFQKKSVFFPSFQLLLTTVVVSFLVGCSTPPRPAPKLGLPAKEISNLPKSVVANIKILEKEQERNAVLNLTDTAVSALAEKNKIAPNTLKMIVDKALDLAIDRIEDVYADTPEAKKARSLWYDEDSKDFKGEPYERSFVFIVRGLRYYEAGDFDNAIACFKSGILQDSLSVEGKFNADMASLEWMIGLCHQKLGEVEDAKDAFNRATKIHPNLLPPDKDDNAVVIFFVGNGPIKNQTGKYKDILLLEPGISQSELIMTSYAQLGIRPSFNTAKLFEDVFFQATTRGGRAIDEINKYKSTVKDNAKIIGNISILLGFTAVGTALLLAAAKSGNGDAMIIIGGVGLGLIAAGLGAHGIALLVKTKADIRTFKSIPGKIMVWSGRMIPGARLLGVLTSDMTSKSNLGFKNVFINPDDNHNVIYVFSP